MRMSSEWSAWQVDELGGRRYSQRQNATGEWEFRSSSEDKTAVTEAKAAAPRDVPRLPEFEDLDKTHTFDPNRPRPTAFRRGDHKDPGESPAPRDRPVKGLSPPSSRKSDGALMIGSVQSLHQEVDAGSRPRLVVGIDFGTAYTGELKSFTL